MDFQETENWVGKVTSDGGFYMISMVRETHLFCICVSGT